MENISIDKKIQATNNWGLVAILHQALIENFNMSEAAIVIKDYTNLNGLINNSRDILTELIITFKDNDDLSTDLREIYIFINKIITEAEIKRDPKSFYEAKQVILPILEGFKELEEKEEPNIVTGLTYGKSSLEEYRDTGKTFEG